MRVMRLADFKNVSIVAHYIKERTKNAQFVIISLRNNMFELADRLVGIYKTNNATKSVAINPGYASSSHAPSCDFHLTYDTVVYATICLTSRSCYSSATVSCTKILYSVARITQYGAPAY